MTIANRLHHRARTSGRRQTVLTIVGDDHNVHCLDEAQLDAWWASLAPHHKADLYERELEGTDEMTPAIADAIGESFVRLRSAEAILNEAKRVASMVVVLNEAGEV